MNSAVQRWTPRLALIAGWLAAMAVANYALSRRAERRYPPRGKFITIDGVKLHYLEQGHGPPLVLLHGNGALAEDFDISGLMLVAAEHHRVIAFDRPGFGYSERPRGCVWSARRQARLILDALHELGIERAAVLGHSWVTLVALAMALDQPQRVSRLILMSGYYYPSLRADLPLLSWPALPLIGHLWRHTIMPLLGRVMAGRAERQLFAPAPVARRFLKQFPLALSLRPSQLRASSAEAGLMLLDAARLSTRYAELSLPITILAGDGDRLVSPTRQSERLHEALPQSEYLVLPETGHMTHYVLHALRSTLAAVRAPTSMQLAGEMTQQADQRETAAWRESSD